MTEFAPAVRTNTAIVLALAGASGSGKTKSALELAVGLAGEGQILLIDSEGRRGLHYADEYRFLHYDWRPPFSPKVLGELLRSADQQKIAVVIVDSMSDEHEGEGGLCDMADAEYKAQKETSKNSAAAWARPKAEHKLNIVRWLRQAHCHVIFCLRADERVEFQLVNGKTKVVPLGWTPIAEKRLLYDVTTSLLFTPDRPGVPKPIKLYDKHAPFFPSDRQVSREAGKRLAEWAAGGSAVLPQDMAATSVPTAAPPAKPRPLGETDGPPTAALTMLRKLNQEGWAAAGHGLTELEIYWKALTRSQKSALGGREFIDMLKDEAAKVSFERSEGRNSDVFADDDGGVA